MNLRAALGLFLTVAFFLPGVIRSEPKAEVDVVVDMTPEGRKLLHPSPGHPAYYYPVVAGYKQEGDIVAGEKKPPPSSAVLHLIAVELARQGYRVLNPAPFVDPQGEVTYADGTVVTVPPEPVPGKPVTLNVPGDIPLTKAMIDAGEGPYSGHRRAGPKASRVPTPLAQVLQTVDPVHGPVIKGLPSLILVIRWGYMNPIIQNYGDISDPSQDAFLNQSEMLALVGGNTLGNLDADFEKDEVLLGAQQDRYFVMISAYDFTTYVRTRKKTPLWQAKMSVPSRGVYLEEVLAPLVHVGGPWFGTETTQPKMVLAPITPEGKVEVGALTLKDYLDAPSPPPAQAPAK